MEAKFVPVDDKLNAIVEFDETFPFILSRDNLCEFENGFVNWHKQPTIEISFVVEGAVDVLVLSKKFTVKEGDGFFIMPGNLHSVMPSSNASSSIYFTFIFQPEVLYGKKGNFFYCEYYTPFAQSKIPFFTFSSSQTWEKDIWKIAKEMEGLYHNPSGELKLQMQRTLQDIWIAFYHHILISELPDKAETNTKKILDMILYLHTHYEEKFSLADMAEQVTISKSECCRYFKKIMHITISEYLLEYRLSKAIQLLESSSMSITEIAHATGFCDSSYFIHKFQQKLKCSPQKYRKQLNTLP